MKNTIMGVPDDLPLELQKQIIARNEFVKTELSHHQAARAAGADCGCRPYNPLREAGITPSSDHSLVTEWVRIFHPWLLDDNDPQTQRIKLGCNYLPLEGGE